MIFKKIALVLIVLIGISAVNVNHDKLYEISKNIEIFIKVYKELNANYVDDLDPNQLMKVGIDAMVGSLDPYTNYISEAQVASYRINTEGKYEGIGAIVEKIDDYVTIVEPYEDSPVLEAGIKAGDQIIAIEGQSTKYKTKDEVTAYYRGVPGTTVRLRIRDIRGNERDVELKRSEVNIPNVPYSGFVDDDIAYVSLSTFTFDASKNIKKALRKLKNDNPNIEGVILDLRENGGGLLKEAIQVSNLFIPRDKEVVSVKSKVRERDETYRTLADAFDTDVPLVVLINKNSASASEIVSGVIQDYDRGILMGQRSYGKGLVQNTKEVGYNSRVKLTTSKYYIPSGRCIQSVQYENGEPVDIPDDKRSQFKTSKGRTVLDGGGVTPDVILEINKGSELLQALKKQHLIFKFANEYETKLDTSLRNEVVIFTDYEGFRQFVAKSGFNYETSVQKHLKKAKIELLEKKNTSIAEKVEKINKQIEQSKTSDWINYQNEITNAIEIELATRLNFQTGKVFQRLKNDSEIDAAVELLKNNSRYSQLLNATN